MPCECVCSVCVCECRVSVCECEPQLFWEQWTYQTELRWGTRGVWVPQRLRPQSQPLPLTEDQTRAFRGCRPPPPRWPRRPSQVSKGPDSKEPGVPCRRPAPRPPRRSWPAGYPSSRARTLLPLLWVITWPSAGPGSSARGAAPAQVDSPGNRVLPVHGSVRRTVRGLAASGRWKGGPAFSRWEPGLASPGAGCGKRGPVRRPLCSESPAADRAPSPVLPSCPASSPGGRVAPERPGVCGREQRGVSRPTTDNTQRECAALRRADRAWAGLAGSSARDPVRWRGLTGRCDGAGPADNTGTVPRGLWPCLKNHSEN